MASSDAPNSRARSRGATCSGFMNSDTIQNITIAPNMRRSVTTNGETMPPIITIFAIGDINPQMVLAANIERCPFMLIFSISGAKVYISGG